MAAQSGIVKGPLIVIIKKRNWTAAGHNEGGLNQAFWRLKLVEPRMQ